jgi:hypothetical protein
VQKGDFPHDKDREHAVIIRDYRRAFWCCFCGYNDFREHSDLWIPAGIGVIELASYPVLLVLGQIFIIGGWIGVKTAGGWMGWQASRTSFNRFLLFNLLNLFVSYFLALPLCSAATLFIESCKAHQANAERLASTLRTRKAVNLLRLGRASKGCQRSHQCVTPLTAFA